MKGKKKPSKGVKNTPPKNEEPQKKDTAHSFIKRINEYSNLIVGVATVLLVFVTAIYIALSWEIATETKRLADISVEQFKIRSYPTFLITRANPTFVDGRYKDEIKIINKGEISSYETSILILWALATRKEQKIGLSFASDWTYIYKDKDTENIDILDYNKKIPSKSATKFGIDNHMPEKILNKIKYQLIFIRHKVPYNKSFDYESSAFAWEVKKQDKDKTTNEYRWETLPNSKRDELLEKFFNSEIIGLKKEKKIIEFFKDYPNSQPLKFFKKKTS